MAQGGAQLHDGARARGGLDDELGEERVVVGRDFGAAFDPVFDADVRGGERDVGELTRAGLEIESRVFRVEANLNGAFARLERDAGKRRQGAGGLAQHPLNEVNAERLFGDAVLHLQARVDFEEVELLRRVVVEELDGAGVAIVDSAAQPGSAVEELGARRIVQSGCGRFFDHLLIAALDGAVAFAQSNHAAVAVAKDLNFNVAGAGYELFEVQTALFEVSLAERFDRGVVRGEFGLVLADPHADAAAAGRRPQHDGIADRRGLHPCAL